MTETERNRVLEKGLATVAYQLQMLGTGTNTSDPRGAIEFLASELHAGLSEVAEAIHDLARAVERQ